jgi:hypothetical protein
MKTYTTTKIDFAMTRSSHRFEHVIPAGAIIHNVSIINDRFSSFSSPALTDKTGREIEMYGSTTRIEDMLKEGCPAELCAVAA